VRTAIIGMGVTGLSCLRYLVAREDVAPLVLDAWIAGAGWRGAWLEMALVVGVGMALVALVFYRDRPEDCGLEMDGEPSTPERAAAATISGPETRNMGATTTGRRRPARISSKRCRALACVIPPPRGCFPYFLG